MKLVLLVLFLKIVACLAVAGVFCAIVYLLSLLDLCEIPSWQMFMAVAVFVYTFIVLYDTYRGIKDK